MSEKKPLEEDEEFVISAFEEALFGDPIHNKNLFYVLDHPTLKRQFLNPRKFSFLAFFWDIIFYAYYKRWLEVVLICGSFVCTNSLINEFIRVFEFAEASGLSYGISDSFELKSAVILLLVTKLIAGVKANQSKLMTLIRKGYKVVDEIDADNIDLALARFDEKRGKEKDVADIKRSSASNSIASPKEKPINKIHETSVVALEIESFARLRDKGIITEEEFQLKKNELLNLPSR